MSLELALQRIEVLEEKVKGLEIARQQHLDILDTHLEFIGTVSNELDKLIKGSVKL